MGIFSPDVWTHCNYIAETFGDMFLTHCDTSVPTFTILVGVPGSCIINSRISYGCCSVPDEPRTPDESPGPAPAHERREKSSRRPF